MKLKLLLTACVWLVAGVAQSASLADSLQYYDALQFRMINKGFTDTETPYTRLPLCIYDSIRPTQKTDGQMSAGLGFRFATNSRAIGVRYNLRMNFHMNHMADTGIKGTDLYCLQDDGQWCFVNSSRINSDSIQQRVYASHLDGQMHEYMLYLPLYDGINWLEIGVDSDAVITQPQVNVPMKEKKIVFYGHSVVQGGCASHTGMVATSILQRRLGVECVNLGLSGEGRMDWFMARAMATIPDVVAYVIDPIANCTLERVDTATCGFIKILRETRPDVPIFMVECQEFAYEQVDTRQQVKSAEINRLFYQRYLDLKRENPKNLY
ncbi:MAG: SGNH/GDSL hydrolase family protein, partial [Muribaculaceae bacterium]|nr:SGNH/GDSL hydrolase family protein [Muribaculaceae bacterium]